MVGFRCSEKRISNKDWTVPDVVFTFSVSHKDTAILHKLKAELLPNIRVKIHFVLYFIQGYFIIKSAKIGKKL